MLFWYGRCQQLTPPESRKIWSFRKKSKNISCVFLLLFFLLFEINSMNKFFRSHFGSRLKDLARLGLWCVISSLVVFLIFYLSHLIQWIFSKIQWIFTEIRPARSRLYQRIFEFFLRVRWERAFNSQFREEKRQNLKKERGESSETDPSKVCDFGENNSSYQIFFLIVFTERNATKNDGIIEGSLHMKVKKWSLTPSPPSQCWKLKCWQKHKFDHQHRIQHWSKGGRGHK